MRQAESHEPLWGPLKGPRSYHRLQGKLKLRPSYWQLGQLRGAKQDEDILLNPTWLSQLPIGGSKLHLPLQAVAQPRPL